MLTGCGAGTFAAAGEAADVYGSVFVNFSMHAGRLTSAYVSIRQHT